MARDFDWTDLSVVCQMALVLTLKDGRERIVYRYRKSYRYGITYEMNRQTFEEVGMTVVATIKPRPDDFRLCSIAPDCTTECS